MINPVSNTETQGGFVEDEELNELPLDQLATVACDTWHGSQEHPYTRLSDLIAVIMDEMDEQRERYLSGLARTDRAWKMLRSVVLELRIANDVTAQDKDRRFFLLQSIRVIRRYMEQD